MDTVTVIYTGPPHQSCAALAEQTVYPALLEPGKHYDVPAELADKLVASSAHFTHAAAPTLADLQERANELGVTVEGRPTKQKLLDAIAAHEANQDDVDHDTGASESGEKE